MNILMKVPCLIAFIFICFKGVVCEICGNLYYSQPAFKGRNVTISFKPFKFSATQTPTIFYTSAVTRWIAVPSNVYMYNATLGVFTTVYPNIPNSGHLYAVYGDCSSQSIRLDLQVGCGDIHLRTPNPVLGKNVEIAYNPSPAVVGLTGEYTREWYNESSRSLMTLTEGLLTEEEIHSEEFVLTMYNSTRWTTGNYSVKCTKNTTYSLHTERVFVKVTVPPGQPFLRSKINVQDCPKCLVVILGANMYEHVFCNTSGGTLPYIYLDDVKYKAYRDTSSENIYKMSRIIRKEYHMKTVACSVFNAALEKPLTMSAKLYVALKPEVPVLNVPILREGSPANITCISRGGRPATNLSLWLDGVNYSGDHIKTYDNSTRTYTTILTFNSPARKDWNRNVVSCVSSSPLFETATQQKIINCKYPPSKLTMDAPSIPSYLQDSYTLKFSCLTDTFNGNCLISWTKDGQLLNANGEVTNKIHDSAVIEFAGISKENNGQTITCSVNCSNFDVQLSKSYIVQVPYKLSVHLSVKDEILLNAHATTNVICTTNSLLSDIVWSVYGDTQLIVCNKSHKSFVGKPKTNQVERSLAVLASASHADVVGPIATRVSASPPGGFGFNPHEKVSSIVVKMSTYYTRAFGLNPHQILCETCGNLNYSQPAFKGRNVTIIYKPFKFSDTHTPTIFYSNVVTPWIAVPSTVMYNSTLGVFTTVFDTNLQNSGYLYAKYGQCSSQMIRLDLQDLSEGCGYIYLRTPNPALGKRVEIGYYPSPAVIGLTGEYSREWYNESSSSSMTLTEGLLTEEELPNKEFVLTIYSATRWTTGSYSVKCTESTTNRLSTERVYVKVTVPPGQPFLQSPNIVQECPECLVGILYENFYHHVFCNTSGGTTPSINVGDEGGKVYSDTQFENIYKLSRTIGEKDHMKTVTCSVSNAALEKPLTTSANLFVALKPEVLVLNVPILREGSPANITCISRGGRPATNLSIWLDGANYSEDIVKTYDNSTRTYTTILTFNTPARKEWKSVSCESSSSLFGKTATQQKTINCEYPPTMLTMDAPTITSYSQDSYTLKFSCFTDTYNDHCLLSWTKDGQLHYANTYETEKIQDSALMEFAIVSKENNGQTITCSVNCSNFDVQLSKSHILQVPYKPSAHLSVKDEVLLNADDSTSVTCTATSFPLSDIVWTVNGDTQLLVCNKSEKCVMKTIPIETKEHRNYTCTAYFEFGNYNTSAISSFLAIGRASKQKPYEIPNESENASLTNSNGIPIVWIVIGLGVIFAAVILSTVIVLVRKRLLKKNQHINSSETQPVQHGADMQENETVEMNEDVTYAQVNKIRTKRTEAVGLQTKGSDTNLVYADIDIEHLETASKPPSRQRPPSPTEYADVDFIRTERGSNSDNIIT
ncbi:uncharacterized protein LOC128214177 [Mya arenaria]|uniref:uncharacterized protein LOC128214177 n=1 Tax=Mya arenaria TaxID=6604 RepID=UPI0022E6BEAA|nr:uncharacterized protein LOC128214177 [Mya arenaria]